MPPLETRGRRLAVLALILAGAAAGPGAAGAQGRATVARRKSQIREHLARLAAEQGDVLAAIDTLESSLAVEEAALRAAERKRKALRAEIEQTKARQGRLQVELDRRRRALVPRLRVRYRLGALGVLPILFSAQSLSELRARREGLSRILRADAQAIAEVRAMQDELAAQRTRQEQAEAELARLEAAAADRVARLRAARDEREAALAALNEERAVRERMLAQLNAAEQHLQGMVRGMGARSRKKTGFAALAGRLPMPTDGVIEVGFGTRKDPRYATTIVHKGVDIRAPKGTKVYAVAPGRVVHAGWLRGYGNLVIVDHGDAYFTLMAHLDRMHVGVGQPVEAGTLIGLVGDTASLKGPYLYFEIRHRGQALDPRRWFGPGAASR